MKQIRFGDLVRNSGRPSTLTLWTVPEKNPELQRAIGSNRVLTVQRPNLGTKRDFGTVGFQPGGEAIYLIFPRPLQADKGARVIGINYALLEEAAPYDPTPGREPIAPAEPVRKPPVPKPRVAEPAWQKPAEPPPEPKRQTFRVVVRSRATLDSEITIEASSQAEARARALEEAAKITPHPNQWKRSVVRVSVRK